MAVAVVKWNDARLKQLVSVKEVRFLRRASAWLQRFAVQSMKTGALRPSDVKRASTSLGLFAASGRIRKSGRDDFESRKYSDVLRGTLSGVRARGLSKYGKRLLSESGYAGEFRDIVKNAQRGGGKVKDIRADVASGVRALFEKTLRSRPGQPPHRQTGTLVNSIATDEEVRVVQGLVNYAVARVGTNLDYGRYLEFGTAKMKARPWLRPSFRATARLIRDGNFWDKA